MDTWEIPFGENAILGVILKLVYYVYSLNYCLTASKMLTCGCFEVN